MACQEQVGFAVISRPGWELSYWPRVTLEVDSSGLQSLGASWVMVSCCVPPPMVAVRVKALVLLTTVVGATLLWPGGSLAVKSIQIGVAYAIWSGCGIVLISIIGWIVFRQPLDLPAIVGMGLIIAGVVVLNLFSTTQVH